MPGRQDGVKGARPGKGSCARLDNAPRGIGATQEAIHVCQKHEQIRPEERAQHLHRYRVIESALHM